MQFFYQIEVSSFTSSRIGPKFHHFVSSAIGEKRCQMIFPWKEKSPILPRFTHFKHAIPNLDRPGRRIRIPVCLGCNADWNRSLFFCSNSAIFDHIEFLARNSNTRNIVTASEAPPAKKSSWGYGIWKLVTNKLCLSNCYQKQSDIFKLIRPLIWLLQTSTCFSSQDRRSFSNLTRQQLEINFSSIAPARSKAWLGVSPIWSLFSLWFPSAPWSCERCDSEILNCPLNPSRRRRPCSHI